VSAASRRRLDLILVERGLAPSRTRARSLILAGRVLVDGDRSDKPGREVSHDSEIELLSPPHPYVGRGGVKLAAALEAFGVDPGGARALDVGASTGGFTDCLLRHGAAGVVAVDVGRGQLDWSLRQDSRVEVREGLNARYLEPGQLGDPFDLAVLDLSFISLRLVLPAVFPLVPTGPVIPLVKPQFELERAEVGRGGIVRRPELHAEALRRVARANLAAGRAAAGVVASPLRGAAGNREFLLCLVPGEGLPATELERRIREVTRE
jgi:23S rRNA (cytidine1920-2'-O)/16S rRNA (cytidine1409-2'-O)-methyltransferase